LVCGALRHIVANLTTQYLKHAETQVPILKNLLEANKKLLNYEYTDRILRLVHKGGSNQSLIMDIINNFEFGAKNTVTLIPQIIFGKGTQQGGNSFGQIDQAQLLEIC